MRRTMTVCLLASGLALTGCSNASAPAAKLSPSPTASKADQYLKTAHAITFNGSPSDAALLAFPPKWCEALDAGHSVEWLLGDGNLYPIGNDWGTVKQDADSLVVAATKAYCPANLSAVTAELRAAGAY